MFKLSLEEKNQLLAHHKKERDKKICDKIKAVLLSAKGWNVMRIAEVLFIPHTTVGAHLREYKKNKKLKENRHGGVNKLSPSQEKELAENLTKHTYSKSEEIIAYISKTYSVTYTVPGLTSWLKRNRFSYKKLEGKPAKADLKKQAQFIEKYEELRQKVTESGVILFMDSCHPTQVTRLGYGWIKTGSKKFVATTASRNRVNVTGAIDINSKEVTSKIYEKVNGESTVDFLKTVLEQYESKKAIHVILDGSGYHRSKEVQDFVQGKKLKLHFLPPYSPNLNPIERLWKVMHEYARNNKFFSTAKEFRDAIKNFFSETIPKIGDVLKTRITDKFQRFSG